MYKEVIEFYGRESQCRMMMEECGELIQAVNKMLRYPNDVQVRDNLVGELADVSIMIEQMLEVFDVSEDELVEKMVEKNVRILNRIREQEPTKTTKSNIKILYNKAENEE